MDHSRGICWGLGTVLYGPCGGVVPDYGERVVDRDELDERCISGKAGEEPSFKPFLAALSFMGAHKRSLLSYQIYRVYFLWGKNVPVIVFPSILYVGTVGT